MTKERLGQLVGMLLIVIAALVGYIVGNSGDGDQVTTDQIEIPVGGGSGEADRTADAEPGDDVASADESVDRNQQSVSGLPPIWIDELPDEAILTLQMIDTDGPFPYSKDGSTFQNREGYLPDHDRGYYREYTVDTPGLDHRGARRIVGGSSGELYYTDDHYDSFSEIMDW